MQLIVENMQILPYKYFQISLIEAVYLSINEDEGVKENQMETTEMKLDQMLACACLYVLEGILNLEYCKGK